MACHAPSAVWVLPNSLVQRCNPVHRSPESDTFLTGDNSRFLCALPSRVLLPLVSRWSAIDYSFLIVAEYAGTRTITLDLWDAIR